MTSAAELRQRAEQLRDKARRLTDDADAAAIRADLLDARRSVEQQLAAAEAAAGDATLAAFEAECARSDAKRAADKLRKDIDTFELVKAGSDSDSERIQARMVLPAIEAEFQERLIPLRAAEEAARQAQAESELADARVGQCKASLREFDAAHADPLHDPLAKATKPYMERIARSAWWMILVQNAGDELDRRYAREMFAEVCQSEYGQAVIRGLLDVGRHDERAFAEMQNRLADLAKTDWARAEQKRAVQDAITEHAREAGAVQSYPQPLFQPGLRAGS